jgi:hypothetical protein
MNHTSQRYVDAAVAAHRDSLVRSAAGWRRRGRAPRDEVPPGPPRVRVRRPPPPAVDELTTAA